MRLNRIFRRKFIFSSGLIKDDNFNSIIIFKNDALYVKIYSHFFINLCFPAAGQRSPPISAKIFSFGPAL